MKIKNIKKRITNIKKYYKEQISNIVQYGSSLDPRKTAIAVASALCIGATPLFGFTFMIAVCYGFIFRLNQFIMISVHILVSPLQIILFFPFIRAGQWLFHFECQEPSSIKQIPDFILHHPGVFLKDYLKVMLAATGIWIFLSLIIGYFIYRIVLIYFTRIVAFRNRGSQIVNPVANA